MPATQKPKLGRHGGSVTVDLAAVVVGLTSDEPSILVLRHPGAPDTLPAGPLTADHRTLESGLRAWVTEQTGLTLGYVEQLYTFGDAGRRDPGLAAAGLDLSIAYVAFVREAKPVSQPDAAWADWYGYLPWEDWRQGRPRSLEVIETRLRSWIERAAKSGRDRLAERIELAFGFEAATWSDERVLERYELLFEAGLVPEARRHAEKAGTRGVAIGGREMALDHRRIVATAISRLRGKIKYRPVMFELMAESFTLSDLQRTVEALAGMMLHKQNFRRLVENEGLVEETGEMTDATGGRPARLVRFRREVLREREAPGVRLPAGRRGRT